MILYRSTTCFFFFILVTKLQKYIQTIPYKLVIFKKAIFNVLQSKNVRMNTSIYSELSCQFWLQVYLVFLKNAFPWIATGMLPYFYENLAQFLLVTVFNTLQTVSLNVFQYIFNEINTNSQFSNALPRVTINFLKNILMYFFFKNVDGNVL